MPNEKKQTFAEARAARLAEEEAKKAKAEADRKAKLAAKAAQDAVTKAAQEKAGGSDLAIPREDPRIPRLEEKIARLEAAMNAPILFPEIDFNDLMKRLEQVDPLSYPAFKGIVKNNKGKVARASHLQGYHALFKEYVTTRFHVHLDTDSKQ